MSRNCCTAFFIFGMLGWAPAAATADAPVTELFGSELVVVPSADVASSTLRVGGPNAYEATDHSTGGESLILDLVLDRAVSDSSESTAGDTDTLPEGDYRFEIVSRDDDGTATVTDGQFVVEDGRPQLLRVSGAPGDTAESDERGSDVPLAESFTEWIAIENSTADGNTVLYLDSATASDPDDYMIVRNDDGKLQLAHEDDSQGNAQKPLMTVLENGNVGIGTTVPQADLHIFRPGGNIRITDSDACPNPNAAWEIEEDFGRLKFETVPNCPGDSVSGKMWIHGNGNVGIGTPDPQAQLHLHSNWPRLRLVDTDGGAGQAELSMNSNVLSLRGQGLQSVIRMSTQAPFNSIFVNEDGDIGMGTGQPTAPLTIFRADLAAQAFLRLVSDTGGAAQDRAMMSLQNRGGIRFQFDNVSLGTSWRFQAATGNQDRFEVTKVGTGQIEFAVDGAGNAVLQGTLSQNSDRDAKTGITPVDASAILDKVAALPIASWRYKDSPDATHIGPMAQDFRAAFGTGDSDTSLSSIDTSGVALAAIQALAASNDVLARDNAALRAELAEVKSALADIRRMLAGDGGEPGANIAP